MIGSCSSQTSSHNCWDPVVKEEESECQFIPGRLKSPRGTNLMLPTQRCEAEVKIFCCMG